MGSLSEEVRPEILCGRICELEGEVKQLQAENADLHDEVERLQAENADLHEEVADWHGRAFGFKCACESLIDGLCRLH